MITGDPVAHLFLWLLFSLILFLTLWQVVLELARGQGYTSDGPEDVPDEVEFTSGGKRSSFFHERLMPPRSTADDEHTTSSGRFVAAWSPRRDPERPGGGKAPVWVPTMPDGRPFTLEPKPAEREGNKSHNGYIKGPSLN